MSCRDELEPMTPEEEELQEKKHLAHPLGAIVKSDSVCYYCSVACKLKLKLKYGICKHCKNFIGIAARKADNQLQEA